MKDCIQELWREAASHWAGKGQSAKELVPVALHVELLHSQQVAQAAEQEEGGFSEKSTRRGGGEIS
jgi:hypothetical protein